jgi:hypothetical protein
VIHSDLGRFYQLLQVLESLPEQGKQLREYTGSSSWPLRGVYFFREPGEFRRDGSTPRIVRVGTHAVSLNAKSRLWGRLRSHRGGRDGSGNHRGSIFRMHVGAALMTRAGDAIPTWSVGQSAERNVRDAERAHEQAVSDVIGRMSVLWVDVPDEPGPGSLRAAIERNAIALLSHSLEPIDPPGPDWLGRHSVRREIRESGLWNLDHVNAVYDPSFLDQLEAHVSAMFDAGTARGDSRSAKRRQVIRGRSVGSADRSDSGSKGTMYIPYAARSRFFEPIEGALHDAGRCPDAGAPVSIRLAPGGYDGAIVVDTSSGENSAFAAEWQRSDPTRFPARIRAAATVLRSRGCAGRFLITHHDGLMTIGPAD